MSGYPDDIRRYDSHPGSPFYEPPKWEPGCGWDNAGADAFRAAADDMQGNQCLIQDAWDRVPSDASEDDADALTALAADLRALLRRHLPLLREVATGKFSLEALAKLEKTS